VLRDATYREQYRRDHGPTLSRGKIEVKEAV